jgi:hypothetical protein
MPLLRRPLDHRQRLAAFAADLLDELEKVDLDTIDGEFYWRWCRVDLLNQIEALRTRFPDRFLSDHPSEPDLSHEDDVLRGWLDLEDAFAYLRQGMHFVNNFLSLEEEAGDLYPGVVWRRLLDGERVAMRAAETELRFQHPDDHGTNMLSLKVFSGAWTGRDVEAEIVRMVAYAERWQASDTAATQDQLRLRLTFAFGDEARARSDAQGDGESRFPYILVETPVALPPEGTIAREYDALVREKWGWHRSLPGGESRQEKEVALRTWMLGLLMREGGTFNQAMSTIQTVLGLDGIAQARFGQDRKQLIARVPEAKPYLYTRDPFPDESTRDGAPDALAKGSPLTASLQERPSEETGYS